MSSNFSMDNKLQINTNNHLNTRLTDGKVKNNENNSRFEVAKVDDKVDFNSNGDLGDDLNDESVQHENVNDLYYLRSSFKRTSLDNSSCDTKNVQIHYTREALPRVDHYRNMASVHGHKSRPTLDELHGCEEGETNESESMKNLYHDKQQGSSIKLGWITGVLVRCLSGIWGIMLFLRMGWVVAHAGIGLGCVIILLSTLVSTLTSLSMSAICTNGEVKGGGTYYMISRSLGPEFGGSIGVIFSIANAVAAAMYTIGFSEAVNSILKAYNAQITNSDLDNMRIIGCITLFLLMIVIFIGTEWESKVQVGLVGILIISILNFIFGSLRSPSSYQSERGFTGWSGANFEDNFGPRFQNGETFFSVFSVYFPAATGFLAGANISGDLKDPQRAIPLGTLSAILVTTVVYILFVFIFGATTVRDVIGVNGTSLLIDGEKQGMYYNYNLMQIVSLYGPIIYCGIFAAALSSALGSLVSAPKVFQALCQDEIFPYLKFFAKGSGANNQPHRGYLLGFGIALACCLIADLNVIAPIISNFFLAAYCLINFSCFHASFSKTLGFRPSFRYYNMWISLTGSIVCLIVMFIMNWQTALITFIVEFVLYMMVLMRKPDVNWGSSTRAQIYKSALSSAHKLNSMPDHAKTYRPQILLLSGDTYSRPALIDFASQITQGVGLMVCGNITPEKLSFKSRDSLMKRNNDWLRNRGIKAFYVAIDEESFESGAKSLIQATGIGKLRPNIVFMGYKSDWQSCDIESLHDYFSVIHQTLDKHLAVCILRVEKGFDCSRFGRLSRVLEILDEKQSNAFTNKSFNFTCVTKKWNKLVNGDSYSPSDSPPKAPPTIVISSIDLPNQDEQNNAIPEEIYKNIDLFRSKSVKSTIDVWWLYDDGGLTMLIPYILTSRKQWSNCRLRVFSLADKSGDLNNDQRNMASLLNKFRIDYSDVIVISDDSKPPKKENKIKFKKLIENWRVRDIPSETDQSNYHESTTSNPTPTSSSSPSSSPELPSSPSPTSNSSLFITDSEWESQKNKSYRQIRIRELVEKHSSKSSLIVMTIPIPRKGSCSASLFMAWLETLTTNLPPFLLIRGSQQSVLTFYS